MMVRTRHWVRRWLAAAFAPWILLPPNSPGQARERGASSNGFSEMKPHCKRAEERLLRFNAELTETTAQLRTTLRENEPAKTGIVISSKIGLSPGKRRLDSHLFRS